MPRACGEAADRDAAALTTLPFCGCECATLGVHFDAFAAASRTPIHALVRIAFAFAERDRVHPRRDGELVDHLLRREQRLRRPGRPRSRRS